MSPSLFLQDRRIRTKQGTFKKMSAVLEGLNFRRHHAPSWWVRYKDVPRSGRVSISVSMPACHAGELGSIPRRGGKIATPPASGWSPVFGKNFWICCNNFEKFLFPACVHCEKGKYHPLFLKCGSVATLDKLLYRMSYEPKVQGSSPWWGENIKKKIYQKKKDCLGYSYTFIGEQDRSSLWGLTAWAIVSMTVIYAARCGKRVW